MKQSNILPDSLILAQNSYPCFLFGHVGHAHLPNDVLCRRHQAGQRQQWQQCSSSTGAQLQAVIAQLSPRSSPQSWGGGQAAFLGERGGRTMVSREMRPGWARREGFVPGGCCCEGTWQGSASPTHRLLRIHPVHSKIALLTSSRISPALWSFKGRDGSLYPPTAGSGTVCFLAAGSLLPRLSRLRVAEDTSSLQHPGSAQSGKQTGGKWSPVIILCRCKDPLKRSSH